MYKIFSNMEEPSTVKTANNELKDQLSLLTAVEIDEIKQRMGLKAFRKLFYADNDFEVIGPQRRANKNRPCEISSKTRRHSGLISRPKQKICRDPRFDDLSGDFREEVFHRDYAFISELENRDKQKVAKQIKKEDNFDKKQILKKIFKRLEQQDYLQTQKRKKNQIIHDWKVKERERVRNGKKPYFLKKSDIHKLELVDKFKTLKEKGLLHKHLAKKKKKNASKQRKKMLMTGSLMKET